MRSAGVALTFRRLQLSISPSFTVVGVFKRLIELQSADRAGITHVMIEVDLLQRLPGKSSLASFGSRALAGLMASTHDGSNFSRMSLRGVTQRGNMLSGFVDLPADRVAAALKASGLCWGVFARPWMNGGDSCPFPPGFGVHTHRIVWTKRYSDVIASFVSSNNIPFDGLVCLV